MKKFLPVLILLSIALGGFYWYTQSGEVLDEAAPTSGSGAERYPLLQQKMMQKLIPDEPQKEPRLPTKTQQKIDEMVKTAQMTLMTEEEKAQMGLEATTMMKGSEVSSSKDMEMMSQEEMAENFISRQGIFTEIDLVHKGSGRALIYPQTAEGPILRLEDFSVTRGPDLHVYLSRNADIKTSADLGTYHDLGLLKSSKGNQNYKLPSNHEGFKSVVIWCQAFGVLFSSATLQP